MTEKSKKAVTIKSIFIKPEKLPKIDNRRHTKNYCIKLSVRSYLFSLESNLT